MTFIGNIFGYITFDIDEARVLQLCTDYLRTSHVLLNL